MSRIVPGCRLGQMPGNSREPRPSVELNGWAREKGSSDSDCLASNRTLGSRTLPVFTSSRSPQVLQLRNFESYASSLTTSATASPVTDRRYSRAYSGVSGNKERTPLDIRFFYRVHKALQAKNVLDRKPPTSLCI